MYANILCGPCKERGRRTVLEVELKGPLSEYDTWCPACQLPISGRAFSGIPAEELGSAAPAPHL